MNKKNLNYEELKAFYEIHEKELHSLQISNGLLNKQNCEYKSKIKILKKDIQELSYLLTELIKEKNENIRRN